MGLMMQRLQPGAEQMPPPDPNMVKLLLGWLPPGDMRKQFEELFLPDEEEMEQLALPPGMPSANPMEAGTLDTQTVMARLMSGQDPQAGIQTVGTL